jgi:hypothetical protein
MKEELVDEILTAHLPENAVAYCLSLWKEKPFILKVTKSRQSKVGDFTSRHDAAHPRITLNKDLNPCAFLLTYIHEVAHWHVFMRFGNNVDPHGDHWKKAFQQLMQPLLTTDIFPDDILQPLTQHMINPKASSFADSVLTHALRKYDDNHHQAIVLSALPEGSIFQLHGRYFTKGKLRRTRILCKEYKGRRQYLVPADALVSNVQLSLL